MSMQRTPWFFICLALLLCSVSLRAQWSGSMDVLGGLGGTEGNSIIEDKPMLHGLVQGVCKLDYKKDQFNWHTTLNGKWEPKTTENTRVFYKNEELGVVYKSVTTKPLTLSVKSEFAWTPFEGRKYDCWILYQYDNDHARNHSLDMGAHSEEEGHFSYYYEVPMMDKHKLESGFRSSRSFDDGRSVLKSSLAFKAINSQKLNTWIVFKTDEGNGTGTSIDIDDLQGYVWKYRITPNSTDVNVDGDIHLQRTLLDGETKLKWGPGVRLATWNAFDHNSGATLIIPSDDDDDDEEIWKDSARLRENFDFFCVRAEPFLTADFKWKNIEAHADYACQVYARRLNDDSHRQPLQIKGVYPVGNAFVKWNISSHHLLLLTNKMSVTHPDYLQICWYDRTAGYLDQLYRGNEQLLSPQKQRFALDYEFKWNRFFSATSVSYTGVTNEIDQTWTNEEIDGRLYKVFHWINSSDSRSIGLEQTLGWKGTVITAKAKITYNQTRRIAKSDGSTIKDSFDWRLTGDISANLGKGWSIGADIRYQSKVATFFTLFKNYCVLNARIKKDFNRFTLYLEGRDLLDQPMETSFESAEMQDYWIEKVQNNRRVIVVGAKWKF